MHFSAGDARNPIVIARAAGISPAKNLDDVPAEKKNGRWLIAGTGGILQKFGR